MEEVQKKLELYSFPFKVNSSYKFGLHVLILVFIILFGSVVLIPDSDKSLVIAKLLLVPLSLFFAYIWLYVGVLKRAFVELSEDGITHRNIFTYKKIKWSDIAGVNTYYLNSNAFIGIVTKDKLEKSKDNFLSSLAEAFGGRYSMSIPLRTFQKADPEKLFATIFCRVQECMQQQVNDSTSDSEVPGLDGNDYAEQSENSELDVSESETTYKKDEKESAGSPLAALLKAFLVSLISGIFFGLSIYAFKTNFIIIPFIGLMWILYTYNKACKEKVYNFGIRLLLGAICALQFYIALLLALLLMNNGLVVKYGIIKSIQGCTMAIVNRPDQYIVYYLFGLFFFFIGIFLDYSSRLTRSIIQFLFMKKINSFYVKKDKRYVTIFFKEYADIDKKENKDAIRFNPNMCTIEKNNKNILAFSIPKELVQKLDIDMYSFEKVFTSENEQYRLDLGGRAEPKPYGYSSYLILNKSRQVEFIQLEID